MNGNKTDSIDVRGLSEKDVKMVEEFINVLRAKSKISLVRKGRNNKIVFGIRESDVIGSLTREEMYDYL